MKSFIPLITAIGRGIAVDRSTRRKTLFTLTIITIVLVFIGGVPIFTWLESMPMVFVGYWLVCAWLTVCISLLAIFDMLRVLTEARRERREMMRDFQPPE